MSQYHYFQLNQSSTGQPTNPSTSEQFINIVIGQLINITNVHEQLRKQISDLSNMEKEEVSEKNNWYQDKYFKLLRQSNVQEKQKYTLIQQNQKQKHQILFLKNQIAQLKANLQKLGDNADLLGLRPNNPQKLKTTNIKNILQQQILKLTQQIYDNNLQYQKKILQKDKEILSIKLSIQGNLIAQIDRLKKQNDCLLIQNKQLKFKQKLKQKNTQNFDVKTYSNLGNNERIVRQKLKQLKQQRIQQILQNLYTLKLKINNIKQKQRMKDTYNQIRVLELNIQNQCLKISQKTLLNQIYLYEQEIKQLQKLEGQNIQINRQLINRLRNPQNKEDQKNKTLQASKENQSMLQQRLQQRLQAVKKQWSLKQLKWKQTTGILQYKYANIQKKLKQKTDRIQQLEQQNLKLKVDKNDILQQLESQKHKKQQKVLQDIKLQTFSNNQQQLSYLKNKLKQISNQLIDQKAQTNNLNMSIKFMEETINNLQTIQKVQKRKNQYLQKQNDRIKLQLASIKQQIIYIRKNYVYSKSQYQQLLTKFKNEVESKIQKNTTMNKYKQKHANSMNVNLDRNNSLMNDQPQSKEKKQSRSSVRSSPNNEVQGQLPIIYETSQTGPQAMFQSNQYVPLFNQPRISKKQQKIQYIPVATYQQPAINPATSIPIPSFLASYQNQQSTIVTIPQIYSDNDKQSSRRSSSLSQSTHNPTPNNTYQTPNPPPPVYSNNPPSYSYPVYEPQVVSVSYKPYEPVTYIPPQKVYSPINTRYFSSYSPKSQPQLQTQIYGSNQPRYTRPMSEITTPTILNTNITFNNYPSQYALTPFSNNNNNNNYSNNQSRYSLSGSEVSTKGTSKNYYMQYRR